MQPRELVAKWREEARQLRKAAVELDDRNFLLGAREAETAAETTDECASELEAALAEHDGEIERLRAALRKALPVLREAAEPDVGYGFFPGGNPRDFTPDDDCTAEERANYAAACKAWDEHGTPAAPSGRFVDDEGKTLYHALCPRLGIGAYTTRDAEAAAAFEAARDALK